MASPGDEVIDNLNDILHIGHQASVHLIPVLQVSFQPHDFGVKDLSLLHCGVKSDLKLLILLLEVREACVAIGFVFISVSIHCLELIADQAEGSLQSGIQIVHLCLARGLQMHTELLEMREELLAHCLKHVSHFA